MARARDKFFLRSSSKTGFYVKLLPILGLAIYFYLQQYHTSKTIKNISEYFKFHQKGSQISRLGDRSAFGLLSSEALPSVCIIGSPKGGTTDLFDHFISIEHLNMIMPTKKEPGYLGGPHLRKSRSSYARILNHPCGIESDAVEMSTSLCLQSRRALSIEASTFYLEYPHVPENLELMSPNTLVIAMLREPVERAVSHYNQWKSLPGIGNITNSFAAESFLEFVQKKEVSKILSKLLMSKSMMEIKTLYSKLVQLGLLQPRHMRLFGGSLYAYSLATWAVTYCKPAKCIVINSHAYFQDRSFVIRNLLDHIFSDPSIADNLNHKPTQNQKPIKTNSSYIDPKIRERLHKFFEPHNKKLWSILELLREKYDAKVIGFNESYNFPAWIPES